MPTVGQNQAEMIAIASELATQAGPKQAYWKGEAARLAKMAELRAEIDRLNGLPEVKAHDAEHAKAARFLVNASGYVGTTKDGRQIYVVRNAMKTAWLVHAGKDSQLCGAVTILNMFPITQHNAAVDWASEQIAA